MQTQPLLPPNNIKKKQSVSFSKWLKILLKKKSKESNNEKNIQNSFTNYSINSLSLSTSAKAEFLAEEPENDPIRISGDESMFNSLPNDAVVTPGDELSEMLREWVFVKTHVSFAVVGARGVGKNFLTNVLLEATFQDTHSSPETASSPIPIASASIDTGFFLIDDERKTPHPEEPSDQKNAVTWKVNDEFISSINWASELDARNNVRDYCKTGSFNKTMYDRHCYVLPQGPFRGHFHSNYSISYAKIPELLVTFITEAQLRKLLWQVHEDKYEEGSKEDVIKNYKQLFELPKEAHIPLQGITSAEQLPIPGHILQVLGQSFKYSGDGKDLNIDRIYIREQTLEIIWKYGFIIEKIHLKLPCGILRGNRMLSVVDSDAAPKKKKSPLDQVNLMLVAMDKRGLTPDICDVLKSSGFISRLVTNSREHKIVFIDLSEREDTESPFSGVQMLNFKSKEHVMNMKQHLLKQMQQLLIETGDIPFDKLKKTDKILNSLGVICVKPLLFSSLNIAGLSAVDIRNKTNVPVLLANISNMLLSKCAKPLKDFNKSWMKSNPNHGGLLTGIQNRLSSFISKKTNSRSNLTTEETLFDLLQERSKSWRAGLLECEKQLRILLQQKAKEANQNAIYNENAFDTFVESICAYWQKNITDVIPPQMESMIQFSYQLLTDSSKIVKLPIDATEREMTRVLQILKLSNNTVEQTIRKRMTAFRDFFTGSSPAQMVKNNLMQFVEYHMIKNRNCPQISDQAIRAIYSSLAECINFGLQQLEFIQNHIEDCIQCIVQSPSLKSSQVMNFLLSAQKDQKQFDKEHAPIARESPFRKKRGALTQSGESIVNEFSRDAIPFDENIWNNLNSEHKYKAAEFVQRLKKVSLSQYTLNVDSNSQFRVLSYLVYGVTDSHTAIRLMLMNEILSNSSYYSKYIVEKGIDIEEYVFIKSRDGESGDFITLMAFANFYRSILYIYSPVLHLPILIKPKTNPNDVFCIAFYGYDNYQPLLRIAVRPLLSIINVEEELSKLDHLHINDKCPGPHEHKSKQNKTQKVPTILKMHSLVDLCIAVICRYCEYLPYLGGALPEDLVQKILTSLISQGRMTHEVLAKTIDPYSTSLSLSEFRALSTDSCSLIGQNCKYLRKLGLSHCIHMAPADLMQIVAGCPALEEINLQKCYQLDDTAIQMITKCCPSITSLDVSHCNKISDAGVQTLLCECRCLRSLNLSHCVQLTDNSFNYMVESMNSLDIRECPQISEQTLQSISKMCGHLECLRVSGPRLRDASIQMLTSSCKRLKVLELNGCENLTDAALESIINNCNSIQSISVSDSKQITGECIESMDRRRLSSIQHLDFTKCVMLSSDAIKIIGEHCNQLQSLCIDSCEEVREDALLVVARNCTNLQHLNVSGCMNVTDLSVTLFAQSCPHLQRLILFKCTKITNHSLHCIAATCASLIELNVNACDNITDDGIRSIAETCKYLRSLYIEDTNITDDSITWIATRCPDLESLSIAYCKQITDQSLAALAKHSINLKNLDISNIKNISVGAVNSALSSLLQLQSLSMRGYLQISTEAIVHPNLQMLNLSWCKNLQDVAVTETLKGCPSLECLQLNWCTNITTKALHPLSMNRQSSLRILSLRGCSEVSVRMIGFFSSPDRLIYI